MGTNWEQLAGGSVNPYNIKRDDGTPTADYGEHIICDGGTVTLPSAKANEAVLVSNISQRCTITASSTVDTYSEIYHDAEDPVLLVSDGSAWYVANNLDYYNVIPDSLVSQYDAQAISANDGDPITTWQDSQGNYDVTGGSPIYRTNGINGNPSLEFDGTDDEFSNDTPSLTQPNTVIAVAEANAISNTHFIFEGTANDSDRNSIGLINGDWTAYAGAKIIGTSTQKNIITAVFDGVNGVLRENGVQTASGDVGAYTLNGFLVGDNQFDNPWDGFIGEIRVYDARLSTSQIESEENSLASKWGITI